MLVGVWTSGTSTQANASLYELARLAETAGSQVLDGLIQRRPQPDPATYIGSGKVDELRAAVQAAEADTVICDGELSPGQLRQLEDKLKVKVIDRTALILDIFAQHARSRDGKAQVELAQLSYLLPRLRGWGEALSRQVGGRAAGGVGIGGRGPGETKIELDRRRIRTRMAKLRREIGAMKQVRDTQRGARRRHEVPSVAIVGYTNAGKSSLLNALTGAGVLVEDALFATLDPTTRRATTEDGRTYTLTDTVGFVRHLPHQLVEAFRSTLEETAAADLLVHVVDASDALPEEQIAAVRQVLVEIGAEHGAMPHELLVVNKIDAADDLQLARLRHLLPDAVFVSAHRGDGLALLRERIAGLLPRPEVELEMLRAVPAGLAGRPGARRGRGARRGAHAGGHPAARPRRPRARSLPSCRTRRSRPGPEWADAHRVGLAHTARSVCEPPTVCVRCAHVTAALPIARSGCRVGVRRLA